MSLFPSPVVAPSSNNNLSSIFSNNNNVVPSASASSHFLLSSPLPSSSTSFHSSIPVAASSPLLVPGGDNSNSSAAIISRVAVVEHNPYALVLALIPVLTIFGNSMVILAVKREKSLQTVTNLLIVSLASADLLVAICVMFFAVYFEWNSFVWDLGPTLCNLYIGADVACSTASILNLLAISIDRYIAISHPLAYCQIGTKNHRAYISIALVWSVSIAVAVPVAFGANHIENVTECSFTNPVFMIGSSVFSFFVPCLAMIALYAVIFRRLREREKARDQRKRGATTLGGGAPENALILNALMGGARMARQIAKSHLKDHLLLELSLQTSSFPTPSDDDDDDEEEQEEENDEPDPSDSSSQQHDHQNHPHRHKTSHLRLCATDEQSRRPTLCLMMNGGAGGGTAGGMPFFPLAPMNPLKLPKSSIHRHAGGGTIAERRRTKEEAADDDEVMSTFLTTTTTTNPAVANDAALEHHQNRNSARMMRPSRTVDRLHENVPEQPQQLQQQQKATMTTNCRLLLLRRCNTLPPVTHSCAVLRTPDGGNAAITTTASQRRRQLLLMMMKRTVGDEQQQQSKCCNNNNNNKLMDVLVEEKKAKGENWQFCRRTESIKMFDSSKQRIGTTAPPRRHLSKTNPSLLFCQNDPEWHASAVVQQIERSFFGKGLHGQLPFIDSRQSSMEESNSQSSNNNSNNSAPPTSMATAKCNGGQPQKWQSANSNNGTRRATPQWSMQPKHGGANCGWLNGLLPAQWIEEERQRRAVYVPPPVPTTTTAQQMPLTSFAVDFSASSPVAHLANNVQRHRRDPNAGAAIAALTAAEAAKRRMSSRTATTTVQSTIIDLHAANAPIGSQSLPNLLQQQQQRIPSQNRTNMSSAHYGTEMDGTLQKFPNNKNAMEMGVEENAQLDIIHQKRKASSNRNCHRKVSSHHHRKDVPPPTIKGKNRSMSIGNHRCVRIAAIERQQSFVPEEEKEATGMGKTVPKSSAQVPTEQQQQNGSCSQHQSAATPLDNKSTTETTTPQQHHSPLQRIRNAFRRSLLAAMDEKRRPSRQLLKRATKQMRREQKATVTLAVVLAVFLCCWVPFFALHLSNALCLLSGGQQCVHMLAMFLSTWLGYMNSSLNPLIYTVFDKRFRKAFSALLCRNRARTGAANAAAGGGGGINRRRAGTRRVAR